MNESFIWPEVKQIYDRFNKDKEAGFNLSYQEFKDYRHSNSEPRDLDFKCTLAEELFPLNTGIEQCSTLNSCFNQDKGIFDNSICNSRESCGEIIMDY